MKFLFKYLVLKYEYRYDIWAWAWLNATMFIFVCYHMPCVHTFVFKRIHSTPVSMNQGNPIIIKIRSLELNSEPEIINVFNCILGKNYMH